MQDIDKLMELDIYFRYYEYIKNTFQAYKSI
jgi:hypothetical protein